VALEQADGNRDLEVGRNRGDDGDPYPGSTGNTTFDETSTPSSADTLGRPTGVYVRKIAVDGGLVEGEAGV
jgi:immune inhibitor A